MISPKLKEFPRYSHFASRDAAFVLNAVLREYSASVGAVSTTGSLGTGSLGAWLEILSAQIIWAHTAQ
jgi:hypothetical protein